MHSLGDSTVVRITNADKAILAGIHVLSCVDRRLSFAERIRLLLQPGLAVLLGRGGG